MDAHIDVSETLTVADWVSFALILFLTLGTVVWGNIRHRQRAGKEPQILDLLLMGRRLTLPLFTGTLVATWYGGILPVTEFAFETGLYSWMTQGAFWYAAYLIFAFFLVERIRTTGAATMPELLARQFGPRSGTIGAWMNLFNVLPVTYVLSLGLFLQLLFGGSLFLWMAGGTTLVLAYATVGGLRSVVLSDLVQFGVMCLSVALVIVFSMITFGDLGWLRAQTSIPETHWSPFHSGIALSSTLIWGLIAFGTLVDPNFYQRCLAAENPATARRGILLATLVWVGFDFCTTFGAFYARAVIPEAASETAYLTYSLQILPAGLRGLFLAGVLATILSTLDSYLFLSGTIVGYDLAPARLKGRPNYHHLGTITIGILAVFLTRFFLDTRLVDIWKFFAGFSTACLLCPLILGLLCPGRLTDRQFTAASLGGAVTMALYWALGFLLIPEHPVNTIEPFYAGIVGTLPGTMWGLFGRVSASR